MELVIIISPLVGAIINLLLLGYEKVKRAESDHLNLLKAISGTVACSSILLSFVVSLMIFGQESKKLDLLLWIPLEGYEIKFSAIFDELSKTALLYVTGVSSLIHIYSVGYMAHDRGFIRYFMLLNLFVFFMIQIVVAGNLVQLFLGWEGVGLCSYLLIGFWYSVYENARAGFKAFITNRIGDFGFIVGIVLFLIYTGGLSFDNKVPQDKVFEVAFFLFMGAMGKSAQGPLWLWLPDAMRGPTPVSALIHAATMVTAGVYMVVRIGNVFGWQDPSQLVFWVGIITSIIMGFFGLFERDIKRILAFSTLSQLGLMFSGAAAVPYTGIFHVFEHSFFKAALFLISGILMHEFDNETDIWKIRERKPAQKGMMLSYFGFLICSLAMSGVFPLSGFWSKESIIAAVSEKYGTTGQILMIIASFITPLYMMRAFFVVFGGQKIKFSFSPKHEGGGLMFWPVFILVVLSIVGGIFNVGEWLGEKYGYSKEQHHAGPGPILVHIIVFSAITLAYLIWGKGKEIVKEEGAGKIMWRKFYLNEIEEGTFIGSAIALMKICYSFIERIIIEGVYALTAAISRVFGSAISLFHGGEPARIILLLLVGIVIALILV
jgi:NADH-quinone oxidoreductase subunit L